ncbi:MAG: hypothetical protein ABIB47_03615 [Candidatus Woesearchaeota archaeon]
MPKKRTKKTHPKTKDSAVKKAKKEYRALKKKFTQTEKKVREYIKKNPKKAALIAGMAATAIGLGLRKALKKK